MDIVAMAHRLTASVATLVGRVRRLYYAVVLMGRTCPRCNRPIEMIAESRCRCASCGDTFDPTVEFQQCPDCGGRLKLVVRRHRCTQCGADVYSRFVFDTLPFDRQYFRERMTESRQRKRPQQEHLRRMVAEDRSESLPPLPVDLDSMPGLVEALDGLSVGPEIAALAPLCEGLDLRRYQTHVQAHVGPIEVCFDRIPRLEKDVRKDRIWRFVAIVFMAHAGLIEICQQGETLWLSQTGLDGSRAEEASTEGESNWR